MSDMSSIAQRIVNLDPSTIATPNLASSTVTICGLIALSRNTMEYSMPTLNFQDLLFKQTLPAADEVLPLIHHILQHQRKFGKADNVRTSLDEEISQVQLDKLHTDIAHLMVDNTQQPGPHTFAKKYTELSKMLPNKFFVPLAVIYCFAILIREKLLHQVVHAPEFEQQSTPVFIIACKSLLNVWYNAGIESKNHLLDSIELLFRTDVDGQSLKKGGAKSGVMQQLSDYFDMELRKKPSVSRSKRAAVVSASSPSGGVRSSGRRVMKATKRVKHCADKMAIALFKKINRAAHVVDSDSEDDDDDNAAEELMTPLIVPTVSNNFQGGSSSSVYMVPVYVPILPAMSMESVSSNIAPFIYRQEQVVYSRPQPPVPVLNEEMMRRCFEDEDPPHGNSVTSTSAVATIEDEILGSFMTFECLNDDVFDDFNTIGLN